MPAAGGARQVRRFNRPGSIARLDLWHEYGWRSGLPIGFRQVQAHAFMTVDISNLYQSYRKELINHLSRIVKCPDTAQDLVQDSYIILAKTSIDTPIEHPRGFLYRIAGNLALDYLRHSKIVERHVETHVADEAQHPSPEQEVGADQRRTLLHLAIAELPPRCRDVFILHKLRGLSYREIAQRLAISESAVEKHIIKGLQHCRDRLGPHFGRPDFD